jgi:hypothetical protein
LKEVRCETRGANVHFICVRIQVRRHVQTFRIG